MNKKPVSAKTLKLIRDAPESSVGSILNTSAEGTKIRDISVVFKVILRKTEANIKIRNLRLLNLLVVALFCVAMKLSCLTLQTARNKHDTIDKFL
jgi:hypothetical protein